MALRWLGRACCVVGALLFSLSVAVQHNDPDPLPWMLVYGAAVVVCVAGGLDRDIRGVAVVVAAVGLLWGLTLLPSALQWLRSEREAVAFTMKTGDVIEEQARECGGLLLVFVWCAGIAAAQQRRHRLR